jgi:hypothetical protein
VKEKSNLWWPIVLMVAFAATRWPGLLPQNFSAAYALAFCCGVYLPRKLAWWLPLSTLLVTNILLNRFHYHAPIYNGYLLVTTGTFALLIFLGQQFSPRSSGTRLLGGGLLSAVLFYLISNTAAWIYESSQPYPRNLAGWIQALTVGTSGWPETWKFFRNTLLSGGLFTALFVGTMKLTEPAESAREKEPRKAEEKEDAEPATNPEPESARS